VPSTLLSQQQRKWQGITRNTSLQISRLTLSEQTLETHDLAIPLPQRQQDLKDFFRLILLSATDIQPPEQSLPRIERLYQAGGKHIGIIFLLHEMDSQGGGNRKFMSLQATYAITISLSKSLVTSPVSSPAISTCQSYHSHPFRLSPK
jgi:hypothetical protein